MTELSVLVDGEDSKQAQHSTRGSQAGRCRGRLSAVNKVARGGGGRAGGGYTAPPMMSAPKDQLTLEGGQGKQPGVHSSSAASVGSTIAAEDSVSTASSEGGGGGVDRLMHGLCISGGPRGPAGPWDGLQFAGDAQGSMMQRQQVQNQVFLPQQAQQLQQYVGQEGESSHTLRTEVFQQQPTTQNRTVESDEDLFAMYVFKVVLCSKQFVHDWKECPYAHEGETARRRHPSHHTAQPCPDFKSTKMCPRGDKCQMAHGPWEAGLHPDAFRTNLCAYGRNCQRRMCFFAHDVSELRTPQPNALAQHILAASLQTHMSHKIPMQQTFQLGGPASAQAMGLEKKLAVGRGREVGGVLRPLQMQQQQQQLHNQLHQQQIQQFQAAQQQQLQAQQQQQQQQQQMPQASTGLSARRQLQGFAVYNASRQQQQLQQHQTGQALSGSPLRVDVPVPNGTVQENPAVSTTRWQGAAGLGVGGANARGVWEPPTSGPVKSEDTSWVDKLLDSPL